MKNTIITHTFDINQQIEKAEASFIKRGNLAEGYIFKEFLIGWLEGAGLNTEAAELAAENCQSDLIQDKLEYWSNCQSGGYHD